MNINQTAPQKIPLFNDMQPSTEIDKSTQAPVSFLTKINNVSKNSPLTVIAIDTALASFVTATVVGVAIAGIATYNQNNSDAEIAIFCSLMTSVVSFGLSLPSTLGHLLMNNQNQFSNT